MRLIFMFLTAINLAGVLIGCFWIFDAMAGRMMLGVMIVSALCVWALLQVGLVLAYEYVVNVRTAKR